VGRRYRQQELEGASVISGRINATSDTFIYQARKMTRDDYSWMAIDLFVSARRIFFEHRV
jgi:hypothetical protein